MIKIIVTTSDKYHHLLKIFCYLFNANWDKDREVEVVGYDKPSFELPKNFNFVSLGKQGDNAKCFGTDLRKYFEEQPDWFIWIFEDSFIKKVNFYKLNILQSYTTFRHVDKIGRINLSHAAMLQDHLPYQEISRYTIVENTQTALYRLCTQPSIWRKEFLLQYLTHNITPWEFETQDSFNDGWKILGPEEAAVVHNEGVTKHDLYKYDLHGIEEKQINEMKQLGIL
jgi:hypothetical protein